MNSTQKNSKQTPSSIERQSLHKMVDELVDVIERIMDVVEA